jgi:hypothetical protein
LTALRSFSKVEKEPDWIAFFNSVLRSLIYAKKMGSDVIFYFMVGLVVKCTPLFFSETF